MDNVINFYRVNEPYGCFSNFSPHPVYLSGTTWPTTEHYFQAQKFLDPHYRWQILLAQSPSIAATMGRDRNTPLRDDWEHIKDDVMCTALRAKVLQHADVREILLATGDAIIIEHTVNDSYWADGGDGSGKNVLGKLWMDVRAELTKDGPYNELAMLPLPPWEKHPAIPRFSIGWRMGEGEETMCDWATWYNGLTLSGKATYQAMYPEPDGWQGFYDPDEN
jgi:N-glycosidase YbiA